MNNGKNRQGLAAAAALALGVLVLAVPEAAARGFAGGTALCLQSVLPALFPFFVVCELLTAAPPPAALLRPMQRILGLESAETARALLLSWAGGYAVCAAGRAAVRCGAHYAAGCCTLQVLGCCSGPGFVIGCVGGALLGNVRLGVACCTWRRFGRIGGGSGLPAAIPHCRSEYCSPAGCSRWERPFREKHSHANLTGEPCSPSQTAPGRFLGRSGGSLSHLLVAGAPRRGAKGLLQAISSAVTSSLSVCGCVVFFPA